MEYKYKMTKEKIYKKISLLLAITLLLSIFYPFTSAQAQISTNPTYRYQSDVSDFDNNIEKAAFDCMADALVNGLIAKIGSNLLGGLGGALGGLVGGGLGSLFGGGMVPVYDDAVKQDTSAQTAKEVGSSGFGSSSLDSIAFCLANKTIQGMVEGTSRWVKEGLGGNPVFVNNPGKYFGSIADYELERLLEDLTEDLICVNINISGLRNKLFRNYYANLDIKIPRCALGTINVDIDAFSRGNLSQGGGWDAWLEHTSDPYSNQIGAQIALNNRLRDRINSSQKSTEMELGWNNGYFSFRDDDGNITTMGNMVQSLVEGRLNAPTNRLTFADEFDEIMNNLINSFLGSIIGE